MYLSVYFDKNSLQAADFIVFRVSDESLFFDSYSQGEEKCQLGCTVISSKEKKREDTRSKKKGLTKKNLITLPCFESIAAAAHSPL